MDKEKDKTKVIVPVWFEVLWYVLIMFLIGELLAPLIIRTHDNTTNKIFNYASYFLSGIAITLLLRLYKKRQEKNKS